MKRIRNTIVNLENQIITNDIQKETDNSNNLESIEIDSSKIISNKIYSNRNNNSQSSKYEKENFSLITPENSITQNDFLNEDKSSIMKLEKQRIKNRFSHLSNLSSSSSPDNQIEQKIIKIRSANKENKAYSDSEFNYDEYEYSNRGLEKEKIAKDNVELDIESINFRNLEISKEDELKNNNDLINEIYNYDEEYTSLTPNQKHEQILKKQTGQNLNSPDSQKDNKNLKYKKSNKSFKSKEKEDKKHRKTATFKNFFSKFKEGFSNLFKSKEQNEEYIPKNLVFNFGADLSETDKEGRNIIHRAFLQNNLELIENFMAAKKLDYNKLFNFEDKYGNTPLILACKLPHSENDNYKRKKLIEILIRYDLNLNLTGNSNLWTACHWLCHYGDYESLMILIKNGAAYFFPEIEGNFPIDLAGKLNNENIVSKIIYILLNQLKKIGYKEDYIEYISDGEIIKVENKMKDNLLELLEEYKIKYYNNKKIRILRKNNMQEKNDNEISSPRKNIEKQKMSKENEEVVLFDNEINNENNKELFNNLNDNLNNNISEENISNSNKSKELINELNENFGFKNLNFNDEEIDFSFGYLDLDLILVTVFLKILINHCLYWACFFKLNNEYVINKLLDLGANPLYKLNCCQNRTAIHSAFQNGNFKALQLLLIKIDSIKCDEVAHHANFQSQTFINSLNKNTNLNLSNTQIQVLSRTNEQEHKKITKRIMQNTFFKKLYYSNEAYANKILKFIPQYLENQYLILHKELKNLDMQQILVTPDNLLNTPLHLACMNGQNEFIINLNKLDIINENIDFFFFKQKNLEKITPLAYIRDKKLSQELLKQKYKVNKLAHIASVILELNSESQDKKQAIDWIINICKSEKLDIILMEHSDKDKIFLLIDISEKNFRIESEKQNLQLKMLNKCLKKKFENKDEFINEVEPAFSRHYQQIITKKIKKILDFNLLIDQKIILSMFYIHKPALTDNIKRIWNQLDSRWFKISPFTFFLKYILEGKSYKYEEIDVIYRYIGEKMALYYAFITYLTINLVIISILGLTISFYYYKTLLFNFSYFPIYGILFSIWFSIIVQKWKRKSSEITFQWGVSEITHVKNIRTDYLGDEYYKNSDSHLEKHSINQRTLILFFLSLPIIILLLGIVVLIFFFTNYLKDLFKNYGMLRYTPSFLKSVTVTIFSFIYDRIALFFVELENHKYDFSFENSLIIKTFLFRLVSDLTAIMYTIFINKNFDDLKVLIYTMILVKMGTHLIFKYLVPFLLFKIKKRNYFSKIRNFINSAKKNIGKLANEIRKKINGNINNQNMSSNNNVANGLKITKKESNKNEIILNQNLMKWNTQMKVFPKILENKNLLNYFEDNKKLNNLEYNIDLEKYKKYISEKEDMIYKNSEVNAFEVNPNNKFIHERNIDSAKTIDDRQTKNSLGFAKKSILNNNEKEKHTNYTNINIENNKKKEFIKIDFDSRREMNEVNNINEGKIDNILVENSPKYTKISNLNQNNYSNLKAYCDITNFTNIKPESRKVKLIKLYSDNDYGDVNADEIELNNMMPIQANLNLLYADICIILTVSSLFSCLIPLAPIAILVFCCLSLNFQVHNGVKIFKRSGAENATSIGLWQDILDVISTLSIIFNFFLYYYFKPNQFNEFELIINKQINNNIEDEIQIGNGESALFWFIVMEHALLILKYFLRFILPDDPHWVSKEKEYLMILNDDFNRKKEETLNFEMKNYIGKSFIKIKEYVDKETKKNRELNEKFRSNEEMLKRISKELLKKSMELNDAESIIENLEENIKHFKEIKDMEIMNSIEENKNNKGLFYANSNIQEKTKDGQNIVYCTDLKSLNISKKNENKNNKINENSKIASSLINSPVSQKSEKSKIHHKILKKKIEFKFDNIFKNMILQILYNRNIILDDEKESMKTLIYRVYIINIFKNTFEKIEREILNKKLAKIVNNINQPIVLCNSCFEKGAIIYCWECQEKLCYDCKKIHTSNSLWINHHLQKFIMPEYRENVIEKNFDLDQKTNIYNNESKNINPGNQKENYIFNDTNQIQKNSFNFNNFTFKKEKNEINKISNSNNDSIGILDANNNVIALNNNNRESEHNFGLIFNNIFNKLRGKTGITKNILLKENENSKEDRIENRKRIPLDLRNQISEKGILFKLEGFYFPLNTQNNNYKNLNYYFLILYKEYIYKNGIDENNNIETKYIIENQINFFANLRENPLSILGKEFSQLILKSNFNIEEQFLINRICFMRFKQCGAKLTFHDIFVFLKIFQIGTYEEKLRLLIAILDINDSKLVLKSEFEKLLSFMSIQNYSPDFRLKNILNLFFDKNIYFLKSDSFFHLCLNDKCCKEIMCEILQVYID